MDTETVIVQVQSQTGGISTTRTVSKADRSLMGAKKVNVPIAQRPKSAVSSSDEDDLSQDSGQGAVVMGSDLGIVAVYPRMSRTLGEVGTVLVEVSQVANVMNSKIKVSSGFSRLDDSALRATQSALAQGLLDAHLKEKSKIQVSFIFRLVEDAK